MRVKIIYMYIRTCIYTYIHIRVHLSKPIPRSPADFGPLGVVVNLQLVGRRVVVLAHRARRGALPPRGARKINERE